MMHISAVRYGIGVRAISANISINCSLTPIFGPIFEFAFDGMHQAEFVNYFPFR